MRGRSAAKRVDDAEHGSMMIAAMADDTTTLHPRRT
jgi:hypothetical protein